MQAKQLGEQSLAHQLRAAPQMLALQVSWQRVPLRHPGVSKIALKIPKLIFGKL